MEGLGQIQVVGTSQSSLAFRSKAQTVADSTTKLVSAGIRDGLSHEAACLAALIGVMSVIRVEELNEEKLMREVRKACPTSEGRV
jgi:hypothetical protein